MSSCCAVILAAGEGKRMNSIKPKVLCEVLFKPMLSWVIQSASQTCGDNICIVCGHEGEQVTTFLNGKFEFCFQNERLGTGHAVMQADSFIKKANCEHILVLCGDAPFMDADTVKKAFDAHINQNSSATVITARLENPFGYGRIIKDNNGSLLKIVEQKDASEKEALIDEVNSGAYWFKTAALLDALSKLGNDNIQKEYYLTDCIKIIKDLNCNVTSFLSENSDCVLGANDRAQLFEINKIATQKVIKSHMQNGVEFTSLDGVMISPDVKIGRDTSVLPGTILKGATTIGDGCVIGPNTIVEDSTINNFVKLNNVCCYRSIIEDNVCVGPFAHIRPNSHLAKGVKIGDFVEVKNSYIGEKSKISHLTYVGDSDVGKDVNFGCGCVTVNYDGTNKARTTIEDNAFIGCNTNLVAPVTVGKNAYIAAGSTITHDIPPNALAIARARQENKDEWKSKKENKQK